MTTPAIANAIPTILLKCSFKFPPLFMHVFSVSESLLSVWYYQVFPQKGTEEVKAVTENLWSSKYLPKSFSDFFLGKQLSQTAFICGSQCSSYADTWKYMARYLLTSFYRKIYLCAFFLSLCTFVRYRRDKRWFSQVTVIIFGGFDNIHENLLKILWNSKSSKGRPAASFCMLNIFA